MKRLAALSSALGALVIYPDTEWIRSVDLAHFAFN